MEVGSKFCNESGYSYSHRNCKTCVLQNIFLQLSCSLSWKRIDSSHSCKVQEGFIYGYLEKAWSEGFDYVHDFLRLLAVSSVVSPYAYGIRAKLQGCGHGHGGVDSIFPGFIGAGGGYASWTGITYDQGLSPVLGMVQALHRSKECIQVYVKEDSSHKLHYSFNLLPFQLSSCWLYLFR